MSVRKVRSRLTNFSPVDSRCPICGKEFRSEACPHSVGQAQDRLRDLILEAQIRKMTTK